MAEIIVDIGDNLVETIGCEFKGEIVRCKECKHRYVSGHTTQYYICDFLDAQNKDDGYCSYGEREGE